MKRVSVCKNKIPNYLCAVVICFHIFYSPNYFWLH